MSDTQKKKSISQIDYEMYQLLKEKEKLKEDEASKKVDEFVKILTDMPAKDADDLRRVLKMFATDIKHIHR